MKERQQKKSWSSLEIGHILDIHDKKDCEDVDGLMSFQVSRRSPKQKKQGISQSYADDVQIWLKNEGMESSSALDHLNKTSSGVKKGI